MLQSSMLTVQCICIDKCISWMDIKKTEKNAFSVFLLLMFRWLGLCCG